MTVALCRRLRRAASNLPDEGVPLQQLAAAHGSAGQGTLLILLAAPCLLPVPGVGTILGWGMLAMAVALWRGTSEGSAGLPQRVGDFNLPSLWAARVLRLLSRFYISSGRLTRQRLTHFSGDGAKRYLAAKTALMALLIILPIPFGNFFPALALMLLGLGLVARDGLAVLAAAAVAAVALLFSAAVGAAAWFWGFELVELAQQLPAWVTMRF